jgi:co-chaperonin GroES (HSP10)
MRVVVKIEKESDTTEAGLYLPEGSKDKMSEALLATVIEVASATDHDSDEETNISGIPLGAKVLIIKDGGVKIPWDETLRLVNTSEVLAIVDEFHIS